MLLVRLVIWSWLGLKHFSNVLPKVDNKVYHIAQYGSEQTDHEPDYALPRGCVLPCDFLAIEIFRFMQLTWARWKMIIVVPLKSIKLLINSESRIVKTDLQFCSGFRVDRMLLAKK